MSGPDVTDWFSERMSPAEVAELLQVSERRLGNMRSAREGPRFYRPQAGRIFYLRRDVASWLLANPIDCSAVR
jgi:hypothetical protein